ncbi:MAG TPA: hypothetical protein VG651_16335 [Stellaceae bacterium]|nr:hypothetical protein [Stellaceae bacterium]
MIARVLCTAAALGLAGFGFFGNPVTANPLSALGIVFLVLSGVVWFGWEMIGDAYAYREEVCPNRGHEFLQTERLGPALVHRLVGRDIK